MGRRSRSPAGQGAEEGPRLHALGPKSRDAPKPRTRSSSGVPLPWAGRTRGVQLLPLTELPGGGVESGERDRQRARLRNSSREQRGVGLGVCVSAPASGRSFWVRGPRCDFPRPRRALHGRLPALAAQTLFLANFFLFLLSSPSSSSSPHPPSSSRLNAPGEGKFRRKRRKLEAPKRTSPTRLALYLYFFDPPGSGHFVIF